MPSELPEALKNFDELPDTAQVRQPVVEALLACSGCTVWRGVKAGTIPTPRKLSPRVTVWNVGELRQCLRGLPAAGNTNPKRPKKKKAA